jgi:hypothetical protein
MVWDFAYLLCTIWCVGAGLFSAGWLVCEVLT